MNLLFHHIRKDLRHSRWLIALTWLAAAGILWLPATPVEKRFEVLQWLPLLRYGSWVLHFLTIGRIVQLDAPLRDTAFHRSRPVSSNQWLASKLTSALILILPMALLQVAMILLAGLKPEFIDLLLIFAEEMLSLSVVALSAMALSARTRTYSQFIASAMGLFLCFIVSGIAYTFLERWLSSGVKKDWSYETKHLELSRLLITQVAAAICLLAGLIVTCRTRRPERLAAIIPCTALLAALTWFFWQINFVKTIARPEAAAPHSEWPDQSKIEFAFTDGPYAKSDKSKVSWGFGGYNDVTYQNINAFTRMEGLPADWFAHSNGYRSRLLSPTRHIADAKQFIWGGLSAELILPYVGIPNPRVRSNGVTSVEIGDFPVKSIEAAGEHAILAGEVHIPLKRPVVLARIPLKAGASAKIGNRRITLTRLDASRPDAIEYHFIDELAMSSLRGGWYGEPQRRIDMIVINSHRREFMSNCSEGSSNQSTCHYSVTRCEHMIQRDPFSDKDRTISPDWMEGAELIITGDEYGGTFTREFHLENLNLIDKSWQR
jgi:hypothetical protein